MTITVATAEQDAAEQEASREYADDLAVEVGRAFLDKHPDGRDWAACSCGAGTPCKGSHQQRAHCSTT